MTIRNRKESTPEMPKQYENCEIIVMTSKVRTSRGDTRFEILPVKIGSAVSVTLR